MKTCWITKDEWKNICEKTHAAVFGTIRKIEVDKTDRCILVFSDIGEPAGYATVQEWSSDLAYLQWGGSFLDFRNTASVYRGYSLVIDAVLSEYRTVFTLIENTNTPMLKMALKAGFLVVGTRFNSNRLMVELELQKGRVAI
jgi:L-amino acid N-acyltransferase YncA